MEKGDCSFLLENGEPSSLLIKALVILEHQVTKDDVERQLTIINNYIIVSKDGFLVRDLRNLMHLFEMLKTRMTNEARFEKLFVKLLDLCFVPPKLMKSSDVLTYALDIQEFFSWLGYTLVWFTDKDLQLKVLDAIYKLLTTDYRDYPTKRYYLSLDVRREKAHCSILAELIGELLKLVADEVLYGQMLNIIEVFIEGSKKACLEFVKQGAINTIIARLEPTWKDRFPFKKPRMPSGAEEILHTETIFPVLNSLLQHATADVMKAPSKFDLWSLQWAFRHFCIKETMPIQRNNILAILLSLMEMFPDLLSGNLTFSYDIAMLAMARDIAFHPNWTTNIRLSSTVEDHSCMALLLMCISYLPNCISGPKIIEECRVVMGLLKLIGHQQNIKWHQLQACYLIRLALNILLKIISSSTEEFIEDGGPATILNLLNRSRQVRISYSEDIVFRCMEILADFSFRYSTVRDSVAYNGGVDCVIPLLEEHLEVQYLSAQVQLLLAVGICLLEQICHYSQVTLVLPIIISYMKRYIEPPKEDPVQNPKVIISVLSFIWNKVTNSRANSEEFVKMGGVYLLLDVLEMSCLPVRLVALGTIIDLCESAECIPYFITWRKNGKRIKSLLIEIFRQDSKELQVKVDRNGIIDDTDFPIMGIDQFYETYCSCRQTVGSPCIGDMFASCRIKVYCLLQILSAKQLETVEIVDEFYKLYNEDLSAEDNVTLLVAENYLALKLAEAWKELQKEFEKMGLEPIPSDSATIGAMIQITNHWGLVLQEMQRETLRKHQLKAERRERELYTHLRNSRLADAWEALCQMKYIARCSERLFRISSTFNVQTQINQSLVFDEANGQMHRTLPSKISISCVHNQHIDIPTDVLEASTSFEGFNYCSPAQSHLSFSKDCCAQDSEYVNEDMFLTEYLNMTDDD